MIKLPACVTVIRGGKVFNDEAPPELVDEGALRSALKRTEDFVAKCTSDKKLRETYEAQAKEIKAALEKVPKKPAKGGSEKKGK
jgi:hypothetical protein